MNRFRTRKRAKDDSSAAEQSSMPSFKGFRRGKKSSEEEPKKEFDLTSALPSDDNFRTSLLMTNLSARFSMLREQDDPSTKIGKASDDSVLYPKRQSRLADFGFAGGHGGLSDIAEVESIKAPFLRGQVDSYFSDDGSIMNRAKPTDGNVLFGGRQKIYKIPVAGPAATKSSGADGMGGRALYEDDVALSAFQLWRQNEKQRRSIDLDHKGDTGEADETERLRSESPSLGGYNQKRETSSTTSSASAIARYSTAATSVTSQPSSSTRELQHVPSVTSSAGSTPALERSVTRTRRLYEQALTQDMHDQQSSAFSRIDSLSRQRPMGNRTPDLAQASPSSNSLAFHERFAERRPILSKASAPNLRSLSPPSTAASSPSSTLDLGIRAPAQAENKNHFGGLPPLSPPISETGDPSVLPIQPNDRGKATAMGVFQKPAEPYDESRYAQRQLQLQSGRDTPGSRARAESSASHATTWRSRSSSSMQRQPLDAKADTNRRIEPTVKEEHGHDGTFLDDSDDAPSLTSGQQPTGPQVILQRPADRDHPAFRESTLPTPLSMTEMTIDETSDSHGKSGARATASRNTSPPDSPTLGPTSGLSGLVRHHLRSESNASSVYGNVTPAAEPDDGLPADPHRPIMEDFGAKANPWVSHEQDAQLPGADAGPETDEFASQLADARRRVRERLTSYVETDSSRECSPLPVPEPSGDTVDPAGQVNALGIGLLKPKSSRGSLVDRSRSIGAAQSKAMKMLGIGSTKMATSPSPSKQSFDDKSSPSPSAEREAGHAMPQDGRADGTQTGVDADSETDSKSSNDKDDDNNIHPGLRAFRQARRELQRRKELETLARHQASRRTEVDGQEQSSTTGDNSTRQRTPSRERRPPPVLYQQRSSNDEWGYRRGTASQPSSRQPSSERNRSGSEVSGGRTDGRPFRLRNNSAGPSEVNQHQHHLGPNKASRQPMLRSPGLPGTDIRRSPIMPPQGYPASSSSSPAAPSSPTLLDRSQSASNLSLQASGLRNEQYSGQPSPISPLGNPVEMRSPSFAPAAGSSATSGYATEGQGGRPYDGQQSGLFSTTTSTVNDSLRRVVNKHDISEPTFIMSTSRVPTVNLHQPVPPAAAPNGYRSQDNAASVGQSAPPLPPINPLRKREGSGSKDAGDNFYSRSGEHREVASRPTMASVHNVDPASGTNGPETAGRKRRGPAPPENMSAYNDVHGSPSPYLGLGSRQQGHNHYVAAGPPASRTVLTPRLKPANQSVPGGMF